MDKHPARGKIDLSWHKLSNVFRAPAQRSRWKRTRMEKCPDAVYRQLWRLIDGAVRDSFANHPEYLTEKGRRSAANSITKRVVGTIHGYATQVARGRSEVPANVVGATAADETDSAPTAGSPRMRFRLRVASWVRALATRTSGGADVTVPPEIQEVK